MEGIMIQRQEVRDFVHVQRCGALRNSSMIAQAKEEILRDLEEHFRLKNQELDREEESAQ
jgi:hypothetical protein